MEELLVKHIVDLIKKMGDIIKETSDHHNYLKVKV